MEQIKYLLFRYELKAEAEIKSFEERHINLVEKQKKENLSEQEQIEKSILERALGYMKEYEKEFSDRRQSSDQLANSDIQDELLERMDAKPDNIPPNSSEQTLN